MSTYITKRAKELGLKKSDARRNLSVEVTAADIKGAKTKDSKNCAFARACKRTLKADAAYFFRSTAWIEKNGKLERYMLPQSAQKEIVAFDRSRSFEPGVYQLVKPCKSQAMGAVQARSAKRPGRHQPANGKIKRRIVHHTKNIRTLHEPTP